MILKEGKLFGIINVIDLAVLCLIVMFAVGILLVRSGTHKTSAQIVKNESDIEFDIFVRGQKILDPDRLFKDEKQSALTIRNVPYTKLDIVKYECTPWQVPIPDPKTKTAYSVDDPSAPYTYNCLVTLKDRAEITNDGVVIGGNKIKVGLKVDIEGFNYRLPGTVLDLRLIGKD